MNREARNFVRRRAGERCEYCGLAQADLPFFRFQIEHVQPRQHLGGDDPENLALACEHCNQHKGTNLSAVDPLMRKIVPIFNPRVDRWSDHFEIEGPVVIGLTEIGRAMVRLLQMNSESRVILRRDIEENRLT
jgi:hypothetical protein